MQKVGLLSLATALPPYTVEQPVAKAKARELFGGRKALFDRLIERGLPDEVLMTAFGPGFTCAGMLLERQ